MEILYRKPLINIINICDIWICHEKSLWKSSLGIFFRHGTLPIYIDTYTHIINIGGAKRQSVVSDVLKTVKLWFAMENYNKKWSHNLLSTVRTLPNPAYKFVCILIMGCRSSAMFRLNFPDPSELSEAKMRLLATNKCWIFYFLVRPLISD